MQDEITQTLNNYALDYHAEKLRADVMEELSNQRTNTLNNIAGLKNVILNTIDGMEILAVK